MENEVLNSEILFLYDCKECNPNGDPDNENKPRMDMLRERVLVSDVRLKRYIRNYFQNQKGKAIFVSKVEDKTVDATDRFAYFIAEKLMEDEKYSQKLEDIKKNINGDLNVENVKEYVKEKKIWDLVDTEGFLEYFIDIRLFGVTLPIKDKKRGSSITFTGPVQFNWGYSLNKAELIESPSITSHLAGRVKEEGQEGGAIGKDWRVYYSLIAFYGRISGNSAKKTRLTKEDIEEFDKAVWNSILTETNTRTKLNQQPRFYLRVEYKNSEIFAGDLRRYIDIDKKEGLRDINDYTLDIRKLAEKLEKLKYNINKVYLKLDEEINIKGLEKLKTELEGLIEEIK
ncbi:MAG TPA: type I-B CRISPR-associated protein Cas7/Csh2 [Aquifex aeolicus]|nr:type I-B CRISPR-associated protein Cas7/Csh2 [Aquifex aeolicus]